MVSIIIPLYNGIKYIQTTVCHVLEMNSKKEIIIVDDGSTDGGYDYCTQIFADKNDVRVIRKENGGIASARNYGLKNATGEYVLFVDQDDTVVAETIDSAVHLLDDNNYDFVCWSTEMCDKNQEHISFTHNNSSARIERKEIVEEIIPSLLYQKKTRITTGVGPIWAMLLRRSVIQEHRLQFRFFVCYEDDHLFVLDYLSCSKSGFLLEKVGYIWTINIKSYSHQKRYIDNLYDKREALYNYRLKQLLEIDAPQSFIDEYSVYNRQDEIISCIKNGFERWRIKVNDARLIQNILKKDEYKEAFQKKIMLEGRYNSIMHKLLRHDFVGVAATATWLLFIKENIKNKTKKDED